MSNNTNGFASNESGTRQQYAWASPRDNLPAPQSIPGLPGIPKDLNGVPPDLIALTYGAASSKNLDTMRGAANSVKNRIGLNVRGLVNLRSYDDVIYQHTSINPWFDNEGYPILDEQSYFIPGRPRPQYNEIEDKQMENAYKVLTEGAPVSALGGSKNEQALVQAFKAAEEAYHGKARDNTVPVSGGRGGGVLSRQGYTHAPLYRGRDQERNTERDYSSAGRPVGHAFLRIYGTRLSTRAGKSLSGDKMILLPCFGRWIVLFIGAVVLLSVASQRASSATVSKSKEAFIQEILDKLKFIYSRDPEPATVGKTYKVTIKDFSVNDEETYVIIDGIARTRDYWEEPTGDFWTVTLPRGWKKIHPEDKGNDLSVMLGGQHQVQIVRKDLVRATRKNGIVREITIPATKPLK